MKTILLLMGFAFGANLRANVSASSSPAIDAKAASDFAQLISRSNYLVIPIYDSKSKSIGQPVIVRDRIKLDHLAEIFGHMVCRPTSHILAVLAGGPITFYAENKQPVLTLEVFGRVMRLNGKDYEVDTKSSDAIAEWLKDNRG